MEASIEWRDCYWLGSSLGRILLLIAAASVIDKGKRCGIRLSGMVTFYAGYDIIP